MSEFFILKPCILKRLSSSRLQMDIRPLAWARGATLAVDAAAASDIPPYDLAMRDGWAVSSEKGPRDIESVSFLNGTLPDPLKPCSARWINTGGMIPFRCTAVIAAAGPEDTNSAQAAVASERHILRRGTERRRGEVILPKGTRLGVRETALLAEACIEEVQVLKPPKILILSTGSEITTSGKNPLACRRASNAVYLQSLLEAAGADPSPIVRVSDDVDEIALALTKREGLDLIVTIGGTGRGTRDLTRRAILAAGGRLDDEPLGNPKGDATSAPPFVTAQIEGVPLIGLPGNPLGAVMIMQRILLPMLGRDFGLVLPPVERLNLPLSRDLEVDAEGELCVTIERDEEGLLCAVPVRKGNGGTRLFDVDAGAVRVLPGKLKAGEPVTVERFLN